MPSRGDVEHEKWQPLFNGASAFHSFEIGGPLTFLEVILNMKNPEGPSKLNARPFGE